MHLKNIIKYKELKRFKLHIRSFLKLRQRWSWGIFFRIIWIFNWLVWISI